EAGGGGGGKATGRGEYGAGARALDAERDQRVVRPVPCAYGSTPRQACTVHCLAAPCHDRPSAGELLRSEAERGSRRGRHDMAAVRSRSRNATGGPASAGPHRGPPRAAVRAGLCSPPPPAAAAPAARVAAGGG